jgi:LysR family nitrogen assimilation transcriptional regulator
MSSTILTTPPVHFMDECKAVLPKVALRMAVSDSPTIKRRVEANELDLGLVLEDELTPTFTRKPLFRQPLFLIRERSDSNTAAVSLAQLAAMPLILPPAPNMTRTALDRALKAENLTANVVMEVDIVANIIAAVRTGIGGSVLPKGDLSDMDGDDLGEPALIEPPVYLTCSIVSSGNFPLAGAGESVRDLFTQFIKKHLREVSSPGIKWVGEKTAISRRDTRISK